MTLRTASDSCDSGLAKLAVRTAVAACLVVACTVPSLFDARAERPFDESKIVVLQCLAALALTALLAWFIENLQCVSRIRSQVRHAWAILTSVATLTAAYLTASIFSIAPRIAWEGAYLRRQGTITFLSYIVFFLVVALFVRTRVQVRWLLLTLLLASVFPTAYAICQRVGFDLAVWHNPTPSRVTSTAGNSIFLGGYLIMVWPVTVAYVVEFGRLLLTARDATGTRPRAVELATLSSLVLLAAAQTVAIAFTGSVGVWVALASELLVLIGILLNGTFRVTTRIAFVVLAAVVISTVALLASARRPIPGTTVSKPRLISSSASRSGEVRILLWRRAMDLFREKPGRALVGYGPDTIRLTLGRYDPVAVRRIEGPATADRSHNGVLDTVLTIGLAGLLAQTLLLLTLLVYMLREAKLVTCGKEASSLGFSIALSLVVFLALAYRLDPRGGFMPLGWAGGLVTGVLVFLLLRSVLSRDAVQCETVGMPGLALMAGVVGHYVETQSGIATGTSELYFWLFAGLIAAIPTIHADRSVQVDRRLQADRDTVPGDPRKRRDRGAAALSTHMARANALVFGVITGLLLAIMTFDFADRLVEHLSTIARFILFVCVVLVWGVALRSCADIVLSADVAAESRQRARVTFCVASLGIWLTFLAVSTASMRFQGNAIDQAGAEAARLARQGNGLLVGMLATLFAACAVLASPRASDRLRRPAPIDWPRRRVAPALLLLMMSLVAVAWNLETLRADELSRLGTVLTSAAQWERAEWLYKQACLFQPMRDVYYARLGETSLAAFRRGRRTQTQWLETASRAYRTAHQINPLEPEHLLQLAAVESVWADAEDGTDKRRRRLGDAGEHLAAAARLAPRDPLVWNAWGKIRLRDEDFSGASLVFERSLALDETTPDAHLLYADALLGDSRYERALREYDTALALGLVMPLPAISGKALALVRLNRLTEAIDANTEALKIAPEDYTSRKNLALLYEQLGDLRHAVSFAVAAAAVADPSAKPAIEAFVAELRARLQEHHSGRDPAAVARKK